MVKKCRRREKRILVNSTSKSVMFWVFIVICLLLLGFMVQKSSLQGKDTELGYSDVYAKVSRASWPMPRSRAMTCAAI